MSKEDRCGGCGSSGGCGGCGDCCHDIRDTIACICNLDKEFECIEEALGHCDTLLKEKIMTCLILHRIDKLEHKIDRLIRHAKC